MFQCVPECIHWKRMVFSPPKIQIFLVTMRYFPTPPEFSQPGVQSVGRAGPALGCRCLSDLARPGGETGSGDVGGGAEAKCLEKCPGVFRNAQPRNINPDRYSS